MADYVMGTETTRGQPPPDDANVGYPPLTSRSRINLTFYHAILAPNAQRRGAVVICGDIWSVSGGQPAAGG